MFRIGIVEDNKQIADYLNDVLESVPTFEILFTAYNGKRLLEELKMHQAELLIMDIQMPEMDGISAVKQVKEKYPEVKIIMHSVLNNDDAIVESIFLGANGYILKSEKPQKLIDAINDVMEGGAPLTPSVAQKLIKFLQFKPSENKPQSNYQLTERETEILGLIAEGLSYKIIADRLFLSTKTVGKHIENIYAKFHVTNKIEAVNMYRKFLR
jgi:DNA-binding NarL/FixJ family response regulator